MSLLLLLELLLLLLLLIPEWTSISSANTNYYCRAFYCRTVITKAEKYKPRFPISSGAPCALASLFTSVQHCLEMLVHYLVTLSYKPIQTTSLHIRRSMFYNDMRFVLRVKSRTASRHSAYNSQSTLLLFTIHISYTYVIKIKKKSCKGKRSLVRHARAARIAIF